MIYSAATDTGIRRSGNEDFLIASDRETGKLPNLFLIADGMGGHNAGEVASEMAAKVILDSIRESVLSDPREILKEAFERANSRVLEISMSDPGKEGMGTTVVVCCVYEDGILCASVGDSRMYIHKQGQIKQITRDHTVVGEMLRMGSISKRVAASHPKRHMLTRAIGVLEHIEIDFFEIPTDGDEQILMATDGLTNMVSDEGLCDILSGGEHTETKVSRLVDLANANGGDDNITIILVDLKE